MLAGMTPRRTASRLALIAGLLALLAGCAEPRVVAVRRMSGPPPVRGIEPAHGRYRVVAGDTLYSIAFRHGLDYRALAWINGIAPPFTIYPGEEIRLSGKPAKPAAGAWTPAPRARPPAARPALSAGPAGPVSAAAVAPTPAVAASAPTGTTSASSAAMPVAASAPVAAVTPVQSPPAPSRLVDGIAWRWPTDGAILDRYQANDPGRQGIDLGGRSGQPVYAAADGVVVYSGNGLIGYGELIIIKHSDRYLSAYGHNRVRLVKEGERVRAGQEIAEMGSSGAPRVELHFEIRRDGKPVDPLDFLPPR